MKRYGKRVRRWAGATHLLAAMPTPRVPLNSKCHPAHRCHQYLGLALASQVKPALGYLSSADSRSPPLETSLARSLLVIDYVEANKRVIGELFRRVSKQVLCSNKWKGVKCWMLKCIYSCHCFNFHAWTLNIRNCSNKQWPEHKREQQACRCARASSKCVILSCYSASLACSNSWW